MTQEVKYEPLGPARIVKWPDDCKGNAQSRSMLLELVADGHDQVEVLVPSPMDLFVGATGYWLSTYNLDSDAPNGSIVDPKTKAKKEPRKLPANRAARKKFLRSLVYKNTERKPRVFWVAKREDGKLELRKERSSQTVKA
jgi:hypothetical protein